MPDFYDLLNSEKDEEDEKIEQTEQIEQTTENTQENDDNKPKNILKQRKYIIITAVILVCAIVASYFIFALKKDDYCVFYIKDKDIYLYNSISEELTNLTNGDLPFLNKNCDYYNYLVGKCFMLDDSIIYPVYDKNNCTYTLFSHSYDKKAGSVGEPKLIRENTQYIIKNKTENKLFYLTQCEEDGKKETYNLYCFMPENEELLASDINKLYISNNGEKVIYRTKNNNSLYELETGREAVLIDENVDFFATNIDFTHIYYLKENDLYGKPFNGEKEYIDSDADFRFVTKEGGVLYSKLNKEKLSLYDLIDDTCLESDKKILASSKSDQPEYQKAVLRNTFRDELKNENADIETASLYYYKDKSELISAYDLFYNFNFLKNYYDEYFKYYFNMPLYCFGSLSDFEKPDILITQSKEWLLNKIKEYYYYNTDTNVFAYEKHISLPKNSWIYSIDHDKKVLYFFKNTNFNTQLGDLYMYDLNSDSPTEKLIDKDVYLYESNNSFYLKRSDTNENYNLYRDGECIYKDVNRIISTEYENKIFFETRNDGINKLIMLEDNKFTEICSDYNDLKINDSIAAYINNLNKKDKTGTLCIYKNGETVEVDNQVVTILAIEEIS